MARAARFPRWRYAPVGLGLFGGQLATLLGALGWEAGIVVGLLMTVAGWLAGVFTLLPLLWREQGTTWHARSCMGALVLGLVGVLAWTAFVLGGSPLWAFASIKIGSFGLLLPVYVTVAHRMFPFFAGNVVVPGYQAWRPMWLLAALWPLFLCTPRARGCCTPMDGCGWSTCRCSRLTATMLWRWWPKETPEARAADRAFIGLAWLPIAFALYSAQRGLRDDRVFSLAPRAGACAVHRLLGSVLIAMVTRVTQGLPGCRWCCRAWPGSASSRSRS
jgi:uncharacterized protein involved in response to NO